MRFSSATTVIVSLLLLAGAATCDKETLGSNVPVDGNEPAADAGADTDAGGNDLGGHGDGANRQ